jgi:pimeloyl-ACP methyl ester carboxylesterase
MRWRSKLAPFFVLVVFGGSTACTDDSSTPTEPQLPANVSPAPDGAALFTPPAVPSDAKPGDLIWARPLTGPANTRGSAILYWSTNASGKLVAVSGVVFEPAGPPPDRPRTILAWAHGTFGLGDQCAPSQGFLQGKGASAPIVEVAAKAGAVFVASDYEGLGTPGAHPFMVNQSSGRNVLDSIRAAAQYTGRTGGDPTDAVIVGQSQGGAAALLAGELQPTYATDVRLHAVVAMSAPSGMDKLDEQLSGGPEFGYVLMTTFGFIAAYPELAGRDKQLTSAGQAAMAGIPDECLDTILAGSANKTTAEFGIGPVLDAPDFSALLRRNDPGYQKIGVPVMVVHGEKDATIPVENTRDLVRRYCGLGTTVAGRYYPDYGHVDVVSPALPVIVKFFNDSLAGKPAPSSCTTG